MKLKKRILAPLMATALLAVQMNTAFADDTINVYLKGKLQTFEQPPIIKDGSTLVPMRAIFEALGATVTWDGDKKIIDATKDGKNIRLQIGWKGAWIGKTKSVLDVAPEIIDGSTMVPLRFIGEALGEKIEWDGDSRSVLISTDKSQLPKADSGAYKGYADVLKQVIAANTDSSLEMSNATYNVLAGNSDGFFAPNRGMFSLYDKAKKIGKEELAKNPAKYSSVITQIGTGSIFDAKEITLDEGKIVTVAYGQNENSGLFFQIFYAGSTPLLSKNNGGEMVGVAVGESQVSVVNRLGIQYEAPVTVFVAGNIFKALEEYQLQAERGKGQQIEFDEDAQRRLGRIKDEPTYVGEEGLIKASEDGKINEVQRLIETNHVDVNALPQNVTPLMTAAGKGNDEIVKYLLSKGAKPNLNYSITAPISSAAYSGKASTVKLLLEAGAVPNDLAMSTAKEKGYSEIEALLEAALKKK